MLKNVFKRFTALLLVFVMVASWLPAGILEVAAADLVLPVDGLNVNYSGGTWSVSGSAINGTVAGSDKSGCTAAKANTSTLTFTNLHSNNASNTLSFDYNITVNNGSVKIGSETVTGSGHYTGLLDYSGSVNVTLTSGAGSKLSTTIEITNVVLDVPQAVATTFQVVENGSYTVNGEVVTESVVKEQEPTLNYELVATPAEGYKFIGWFSTAVNAYISTTATASVQVMNPTTIYPVFVSASLPIFQVGADLYADLNEANAAAQNHSSKQITLVQSGALPAGTYEISADVKLLIPYNAAYTADFDEQPGVINARKEGLYSTPTMYSNLTLEDGAVVNCYGQINVNAQMFVETNIYTSQVTGPYGAIDLNAGSMLNLESGSVVYCYGYIGGEGTVVGKSGSKVYQMMQICDWRGGSATSDLSGQLKGNSFLFSQYYLQNIEANLKVYSGGTMYAVTGLTAGSGILNQTKQVSAPIIGTNAGLFRMDAADSDDYMTLRYDAATDRMELDLYGSITTVAIEMSVNLGIGMNFNLNTDEYILPLPANYSIDIHSGSNVAFAEKFKMLPGTEITVHEGANVSVGSNGAVYLYDVDDWNSGKYTHMSTSYQLRYVHATKTKPVTRGMTSNAVLRVDGMLNAQGPIYSTNYTENGGNAGITGNGMVQIGSYGSTNLLEVNNNNTDALVTVTCVPVLGQLAGHGEMKSLAQGIYKSINGKWYQYTITGENFEFVSGVEVVDGIGYVANAKDGVHYFDEQGNAAVKDGTVVTIATDKNCLSAVNAEITVTATLSEPPEYQLSHITGNVVVTAKDTHTEVDMETKLPTCTEIGLGDGIACADCGKILKEQPVIGMLPHEYKATVVSPTCVEQGFTFYTCKVCGDQSKERDNYVAALGHTLAEGNLGVITKNATCTEDGVRTFYCDVCGAAARSETITAIGHSYDEWTITTPAGCETDGERQKVCANCGDVVKESLPATGHAYGEWIVVAASTCYTEGTQKKVCSSCNSEVHEKLPLDTNNHEDWGEPEHTNAPTCEGTGVDTYTCLCGEVRTEEVSATGHKVVVDAAVAPTCTATGLTEGSHCKTCGVTIVAQDLVQALGHNHIAVVTPPTCTDQGYTTYTCSRCDDSYIADYTDPVGNAHSYQEEVVEPTCTEQGYTQKVCEYCGHTEELAGTETEALGHAHVGAVTAPTCTEQGYTTYTCSRCGDSYVADYVQANGHSFDSAVTAPTCTEQGYTTHTCSVCDYQTIDSYVSPLGHTPKDERHEPTCTEEGYIAHVCSVCQEKVGENTPIAALGHSHTIVVRVELEATCTEQGSRIMKCERCDDTITEITGVLGHDYHDVVNQEPTCTVHGDMTSTCSRCGDEQQSTLMPLGHAPVLSLPAQSATCMEDGHADVYKCERCDEISGGEILPALGHDYDMENSVELVAATCYLQGQLEATCNNCHETHILPIEKVPHTPNVVPGYPATCTEDGLTDAIYCAVKACRETLIAPEVIPATGHSYVADAGKEPTCTEPGYGSAQKCQTCGLWEHEPVEIPALGHSCDENTWTVVNIASCTAEGEEKNVCSVCGETVTRIVAMTPHIEEEIPGKAATYDSTGLTDGKKCTVCKEITLAQEPIEMLAVDWEAFITGMEHLEFYAQEYAKNNPGKDPTKLMINYIRTGIERYTTDEWVTMAGTPETVFINEVRAYDTIYGSHAHALRAIDKKSLVLPNGTQMVFDHLFGALNVSSKNNYVQNQNDFGSWAGDICDLMQFAYECGVRGTSDIEALVQEVEGYFGRNSNISEIGAFSADDLSADLDAFYVVSRIIAGETSLYKIFSEYYGDTEPSDANRAAYFLNNRFPGKITKEEIREAIYTTYKNHLLIQLLESGRDIADQHELREAACYVFADYLYEASEGLLVVPEEPGEDEEDQEPDVYTVFSSSNATLAPGITQQINYALDGNGKQMIYYMATVDINRPDVNIYANYANHDPSTWAMAPVSEQMAAAQDKHSNPDDPENYVPNYNVILGTNASFYNMGTGEPTGLLIMHGKTYKEGAFAGNAFFAILNDGTPVIAPYESYASYKGRIAEGFTGGVILVKDGKPVYGPENNGKAPRTVIGITEDGKIMTLVVDGRQEPVSAGASYYELGQIMADAGCVTALNLDGGGSTTYVAKQEGSDHVTLVNRPSDSTERSVSTSLLVVSTAETSQEFHHAVVTTKTDYMTVGASQEIVLTGVGAAGNKAEIPEGAHLRVSDEKLAVIDGNIVTALATGAVNVELVLNDAVVGTKMLRVIAQPDGLRFEDASLNVIYGVPQALSLQATFLNSLVTISSNDVVWEMSNGVAGIMDGFSFIGNEASGVRNVTIVARIKAEPTVTASMSLRLYGADESIFDFGNVTAGNESLAWNRVVNNTMTPDQKYYYAVNPNAQIDAEYTFALDMKAIKAPARLLPLMEYLNGFAESVGENATPWDYMLALGGRVSSLTNVTITATFPEGVIVDASEATFVNDFMTLQSVDFDESTRTLTLRCQWIRQTAGIDPSTANSQGILSGMKVIMDDESTPTKEVVITGSVTYDIYLDTSQLYSFAKDPANQAAYGIYDYINPDDPEDAGGHFSDTYITFEDRFVVNREKLTGWVTKDDAHYYYVDNEMITGVYKAADMNGSNKYFYYDFGADGISKGIYTGLFYDAISEGYRYVRFGEPVTGWIMHNDVDYYIDPATGMAANGRVRTGDYITFDFVDGVVQRGVWTKNAEGYRYWYGPTYYKRYSSTSLGAFEIEGQLYLFNTQGYMRTGLVALSTTSGSAVTYYDCGTDGKAKLYSGLYRNYLILNGKRAPADTLVQVGNDFYFVDVNNSVAIGRGVTLTADHVAGKFHADGSALLEGYYEFNADGKMNQQSGPVGEYMFINGRRIPAYHLVEFDGNYYCTSDYHKLVKNRKCTLSDKVIGGLTYPNGDPILAGRYEFDGDGKMVILNGPVDGYFYINSTKQPAYKLFFYEGSYYCTSDYQKLVISKNVSLTEKIIGDLCFQDGTPIIPGRYDFDENGKMVLLNGPVDGYFYINSVKQPAYKLFYYEDSYYCTSDYQKLVVSKNVSLTEKIIGDLRFPDGTPVTPGRYDFDENGKMVLLNGPVDGYFYINSVKQPAYKLFYYEGSYYCTTDYQKLVVGKSAYLSEKVIGDLRFPDETPVTPGRYDFDENGKMVLLNGPVDGYFYINSIKQPAYKLFYYEGSYYCTTDYQKLVISKNVSLTAKIIGDLCFPDGNPVTPGRYDFDENGKMVLLNGPVDGYFYINSVKQPAYKLFYYEGSYYCTTDYQKLVVGKSAYLSEKVIGDLCFPNGNPITPGRYDFDENGKMVLLNGPVDGYFYINGVKQPSYKLFYYEGGYYCTTDYQKLVVGKRAFLSAKMVDGIVLTDGMLMGEGYYNFDENGRMILD